MQRLVAARSVFTTLLRNQRHSAASFSTALLFDDTQIQVPLSLSILYESNSQLEESNGLSLYYVSCVLSIELTSLQHQNNKTGDHLGNLLCFFSVI